MLDTTVLIDASTNDQFAQYLAQLVNNFEFLLYTIPSAQYEFTRMAKSAKARTQYDNLISELNITLIGGLETKINDESVKEFYLFTITVLISREDKRRLLAILTLFYAYHFF